MTEGPKDPIDDPAYGFLALLRVLERQADDKPRIGRSRRTRDDVVRLGQDPFLAFPDREVSAASLDGNRPEVRSPVMGFFGAHGALPLNTTEEVLRWAEAGDKAFVEFTDIFATRFIQLYYRAWADARPIVQFDHGADDRFQKYLLSLVGLGSPAFRDQADVLDTLRLRYTALFMGRIKSPRRLQQIIKLHLKTEVEIEELVPSWMEFEPDSLSRLGAQGSTLGQDVHLGSRIQSVGEKICVHLYTNSFAAYERLLPGGADHAQLDMVVASYLGITLEVDVALWLPYADVPPAKLGKGSALGWMACIDPPKDAIGNVRGASYRLSAEADQNTAQDQAA